MATLTRRLEVHFVACAAAAGAGAVGTAQKSEGSIVYSGIVNVPIPNTFQGIYLNVGAGTTMGAPFAGWDVNPYFNGGNLNFYGAGNGVAGNPNQTAFVVTGTAATNLAPNTPINAGSSFSTGLPFATANGTLFPVGGTGTLGFRFFNEGDTANHFGWAHIHVNAGGGGVLEDYAWESTAGTGIGAGVPTPGSLSLLALGAAGLAGRRRK